MGSLKSVCVLLQRTSPEMERESKETPGGPNLPQREGTESPSWKTEGGGFRSGSGKTGRVAMVGRELAVFGVRGGRAGVRAALLSSDS